MSLKYSQNIENLKCDYIYGSIDCEGKRSFKSLDNLIKQHKLAASTIYRRSSRESWKNQRKAFRTELSEEIKKAKKNDIVNDIQFIQNKATSGLSLILDKAMDCLEMDKSITPRGLYNLTQTIIACSRNLPAIAESDKDNNGAFESIMGILDEIAVLKRSSR